MSERAPRRKKKRPPNPLSCGCCCVGDPEIAGFGELRIEYKNIHVRHCQLHTAAPDLLAACEIVDAEAAQRISFWDDSYCEEFPVEMSFTIKELRDIRAAITIAKATEPTP